MNIKKVLMLLVGVFLVWCFKAQADVEQMKAYKEAFPGAKIKCIDCHTDAIPKKDAGKHELNAYGKKVVEAAAKPTVDTYKTAGEAESK